MFPFDALSRGRCRSGEICLTPMLPALDALIALQDLDTRAEAARRRLADAPIRIAALDATLLEIMNAA